MLDKDRTRKPRSFGPLPMIVFVLFAYGVLSFVSVQSESIGSASLSSIRSP